jgi:hypothetical protein|tara:strand:- start:798 stop:983 length:186 start_codon:yes stop_codon:yes gene_type:complete
MKIYKPQKATGILHEAMKELYLLKQAIEHQQLSVEARAALVDKTRAKIIEALKIIEAEGEE